MNSGRFKSAARHPAPSAASLLRETMSTHPDRQELCRHTADALRAADPSTVKAVIGFDGFVDNLMQVVDRRLDADRFEPIRTIDALGRRITQAAGHSSNCELVLKQQKLGGNGPIFANALATLGARVTYIGNVGYPDVHAVFHDFALQARVCGIAEPGITDALEFDDGKLMLNKGAPLADVTWENVIDRVGIGVLRDACEAASLIGMTNWTSLPHVETIWKGILTEVLPTVSRKRPRYVFIDLADPAKRTEADLRTALAMLVRFEDHARVVLGLNANEARRLGQLLGLLPIDDPHDTAAALRTTLGLSAVVIHSRRGAAAATAAEVTASIEGPFVTRPAVTTGAGDHFNAGFSLGLSLGLDLAASLCCGVAVAGFYVGRGATPTYSELVAFVAHLPVPEGPSAMCPSAAAG